jgi:hypothetical protein
MRIKSQVALIAMPTMLLLAECIDMPTRTIPRGDIQVFAYDGSGALILGASTEIVEDRTVRLKGVKGLLSNLPYGYYTVKVNSPGFKSYTRDVLLDKPAVTVRAQLGLGVECLRYAALLHGNVLPMPDTRELWLKAVPLRGTGDLEARIEKDGTFSIGADDGSYIVAVVEGERVLHTGVYQATADRKLNIRLPE